VCLKRYITTLIWSDKQRFKRVDSMAVDDHNDMAIPVLGKATDAFSGLKV
jgi:hypothetical protein